MSDFNYNMKAMVDHLLYLDGNDTAYAEYHAWRKLPLSQLSPGYQKLASDGFGFCAPYAVLCEQLYRPVSERTFKPIEKGSFARGWNAGANGEPGKACAPYTFT